jgi:hypothetical protein
LDGPPTNMRIGVYPTKERVERQLFDVMPIDG